MYRKGNDNKTVLNGPCILVRNRDAYPLFLAALLLLSGCTSANRITNGWGRDYENPVADDTRPQWSTESTSEKEVGSEIPTTRVSESEIISQSGSLPSSAVVESILRQELDGWMGVPHVLGGTTKKGVDCSALVQRVFADALGIQTPRTTAKQLRTGMSIRRDAMKTGDLVFFRPGQSYRHVGIYLRDGDFAHASSSRGVMISNLSEPYWSRSFIDARRIIRPGQSIAAH